MEFRYMSCVSYCWLIPPHHPGTFSPHRFSFLFYFPDQGLIELEVRCHVVMEVEICWVEISGRWIGDREYFKDVGQNSDSD